MEQDVPRGLTALPPDQAGVRAKLPAVARDKDVLEPEYISYTRARHDVAAGTPVCSAPIKPTRACSPLQPDHPVWMLLQQTNHGWFNNVG